MPQQPFNAWFFALVIKIKMNHYFCVWPTPMNAKDIVADRDGYFLWLSCGAERKTTVKLGDEFAMAMVRLS
ncbi:MAG: hypothetical protein ACJAVI_000663 [Candidatus Azotimanducaceae bacterium]|jgi:hypothetical protein